MHSSGSQIRINSGLFFNGWKRLDFTLMIFLHQAAASKVFELFYLYLNFLHQAFLYMPGSSLGSAFTTILPCFCIFLLYFGSSVMVSEVYSCCIWFLAHHSLSCCLPQCVWLFEGWTINSISVSCLCCMRLPAQPQYILASSVSFLLPLFHIFLLFWYSFSSVLLEFPSPETLKASLR